MIRQLNNKELRCAYHELIIPETGDWYMGALHSHIYIYMKRHMASDARLPGFA